MVDTTGRADRAYRTTREAAAACGLTQTTLRWYERIGLLDRVERGPDLRRRFTSRDLDWLVLLSRLRATGMPVRDLQRYAELARRTGTEAERLALFEEHRRRIEATITVQNECLALIEHKIEIYRRVVPEPAVAEEPTPEEESTCAPNSSAV